MNRLAQGTSPKRQGGVVLMIALIVLVAMSLAAIALTRSVDTNTLIAGNLAFVQGAVNASDAGLEDARQWLVAQSGPDLEGDKPPRYVANWQSAFNPATYDWDAQAYSMGDTGDGNNIRYVVHRLCSKAGNIRTSDVDCVKFEKTGVGSSSTSSRSAAAYGSTPLTGELVVYYRVTTRVRGPRNTTSYVQAVVY